MSSIFILQDERTAVLESKNCIELHGRCMDAISLSPGNRASRVKL